MTDQSRATAASTEFAVRGGLNRDKLYWYRLVQEQAIGLGTAQGAARFLEEKCKHQSELIDTLNKLVASKDRVIATCQATIRELDDRMERLCR